MKKSSVDRLARTFRLYDLMNPEILEDTFDFLVRLIVWRTAQRKYSSAEHDSLLLPQNENPTTRLILILYLSVYDPCFFDLIKKMTASELAKPRPPERYILLIAAQLLTMDAPKQRKPMRTIHALIVMAIAIKNLQGNPPHGRAPTNQGGIEMLQQALVGHDGPDWPFDRFEEIWKHREAKLINLDFEENQISGFFAATSPMQS